MNPELDRLLAVAAGAWWANVLRGPGAHAPGSALRSTLVIYATLPGFERKLGGDEIDLFEMLLVERLHAELARRGRVEVAVEYEAVGVLAEILEIVGAAPSMRLFPFRTTMIVDRRFIEVTFGFSRGQQTIWQTKKNALEYAVGAALAKLTFSTGASSVERMAGVRAQERAYAMIQTFPDTFIARVSFEDAVQDLVTAALTPRSEFTREERTIQ